MGNSRGKIWSDFLDFQVVMGKQSINGRFSPCLIVLKASNPGFLASPLRKSGLSHLEMGDPPSS